MEIDALKIALQQIIATAVNHKALRVTIPITENLIRATFQFDHEKNTSINLRGEPLELKKFILKNSSPLDDSNTNFDSYINFASVSVHFKSSIILIESGAILSLSDFDMHKSHVESLKKIVSTTAVKPCDTGPTLLLIEDDEDQSDVIRRSLQKLGYKIEVAKNGLDGIELAIKNQPDCILLDVMMPKMDGVEATKKLKSIAETKHIPIIALTSHDDFSVEKKMLKAGADAFCSKLLTKDDLSRQIDHLILKIS